MPPKFRAIQQNLVDDNHPPITVQDDVLESALKKELFDEFFEDYPTPRYVGIAPIYSSQKSSSLTRLAIATQTKVIIVQFHAKGKGKGAYVGREVLAEEVLCNPDVILLAFNLEKLAVALYADQNVRILNGVDLQSAFGTVREPLPAIEFATKERVTLLTDNVRAIFESSIFDPKRPTSGFALQAWIAWCVSTFEGMEAMIQAAKRINTKDMAQTELDVITQLERGENRLAIAQPTFTSHDFGAVRTNRQTVNVRAERFQTRFQQSTTQTVTVHDHQTGLDIVLNAEVESIKGRHVRLKAGSHLDGREITTITTQGPAQPTKADLQRSLAVLHALQGESKVFENPFLQYIFSPSSEFSWPEDFPVVEHDAIPPIVTQRPLNDSQQQAVKKMLENTDDTRLTIIQGPPGTGKTTVIAAYVCSAVADGADGIWLVAQSNIAVKNIAEKLADVGFQDWRLLVSNEFYQGWHDHLYGAVAKNVIPSFEFKKAGRRIVGVRVFLCTLSMLAHSSLHIFTRANPIKTVIVDEASQITLGSYVAPLQNFPTIRKICMIGDDKQLPPYGADDEGNIKSIFEVEHLRPKVIFLSIQYRMPPLIGEVVSDVVYEGQLQSNPKHPVPYTERCCWFVHVHESKELPLETSFHNPTERVSVLKIAEKLQAEGKEYCIVTPYDAQRNFLENEMQAAGLDWRDKCFNVDSFQGNERDYIIVSLVRSSGLGFLDDLRRTNVMLTRCKRGMYIATSWEFITGKAQHTLVGRMAAAWGDEIWISSEHITVDA